MADMFNTSTNYIEQYVKDPETAVEKLKAEPKVKEAFVENEKADIERKQKCLITKQKYSVMKQADSLSKKII